MNHVIRQSFRGIAIVTACALLAAACGVNRTKVDASAKPLDVEQDLGTDLNSGSPDLGTDLGFDAPLDVEPEVGTDLGFDAPLDVEPEVGADLGFDATDGAEDHVPWTPPGCTEHPAVLMFRMDYLTLKLKGHNYLVTDGAPIGPDQAGAAATAALKLTDWPFDPPISGWPDNPLGDLLFAHDPPLDFGGSAVVDARTGALLFAGTVVWMGSGEIYFPLPAIDASGLPQNGVEAPDPEQFHEIEQWSGLDPGGAAAFDSIKPYKPVYDLASCGPYSVLAYMHPTTVGALNPNTAEWVVFLSGTAPEGWLGCSGGPCPPGYPCVGGLCVQEVPDAGCQEDKITFTPDNEPMYELYEVCIPEGDATAAAAVQAVDPGMSCGFGGFFAQCADDEVSCNGALETGPDKVVTEEQWKKICLLSVLEAVSKIGGGHYL